MAYEVIERGPARGMQRHRDQNGRAWLRSARHLRQSTVIVLDVLDDVEGAHQIKRAVSEGQAGDLAECNLRAAPAQLRDCGRADIQELGTLYRQSWSQTRCHF